MDHRDHTPAHSHTAKLQGKPREKTIKKDSKTGQKTKVTETQNKDELCEYLSVYALFEFDIRQSSWDLQRM